MYLKSIEIQGFKSFANKTVLDFSKGITGIVGPNGSGKSNIADAVRWVLGEQKVKQLRGASMQDVIFAGTAQRRAQSCAYCAITLDNSDRCLGLDYDEITVTRRLYRSGESEYLLNGTECRLKDINELFYDTGIGKEGYSIIGQGQIDRILSGKPEERRALFDEAVGIVKYKRRKDVAEKKLAEEQDNLQRVTDILRELEKQVEPLQRQAEQAKQYLALRDALVKKDTVLFVREMDEATEKLSQVNVSDAAVQEDLRKTKEKSGALSEKYESLEKDINGLEGKAAEAREGASQAALRRSELEGQINVLKEQIRAEENSGAQLDEQQEKYRKQQFDAISDIEDQMSILTLIENQLQLILSNEGEAAQDALDNAASHELIEADLRKIEESRAAALSAVHACMGEDYALEQRSPGDSVDALKGPSQELLGRLEEKQQALAEIEASLQKKTEARKENEEKLRSSGDTVKALGNELQQQLQLHGSSKNRLETLRNLAERYEGFGNAVKMVMDRRNQVPGLEGVVAELIQVPKKYEVAIETALGGSVQNIVTRDEQTAKEMVQFLKKNRYGRATFLPLSNIRGRRDENCLRAASEEGAIGLACDLIDYRPELQVLAEYLLGRVLVVDNIDHALRIARNYRQSLRIVTLEGDLLNPGGSISGGAYRSSSNLMSRQRELEELEEQLLKAADRIAALRKRKEAAEDAQTALKNEGERLRREEQELLLSRNTASLGIRSMLNASYSEFSARTGFAADSLKRLSGELTTAFEALAGLDTSAENSARSIAEKKEKITGLSAEMQAAAEKAQTLQKRDAALAEEKSALLSAQKAVFGEKDSIAAELVSLQKEAMRVASQKEKLSQRIGAMTDYMLEEYHLTYQAAKESMIPEGTSLSQLRSETAALKSQMKALGSVNLDAIEQYKEVSGRYEFLNTQYQDLVQSEASLQGIIRDLDSGMRKQFRENFAMIQKEFNRVFKVLFGGGQGRIELDTEDGDVLTCGISIIAEPPGKKLQNMLQLSGGEKALTAISLLFAIQSLKPSPFCLLDEIEAALDDSNVARFAGYLTNLTEHTQFIVITHRRGTMERADRLFGITMQEKGISALVSVDLVQDQLDN